MRRLLYFPGQWEGVWLPSFSICLIFGLLDHVWLRVLRQHAPGQPDARHAVGLGIGNGPEFFVHLWQAVVHLLLLFLCFLAFMQTIIRLRRRQR